MTPDQADVLRKALASLQAARLRADHGLYGFAASRAYYTMFYVAQALLLTKGLSFSKHSTVIAMFGQHLSRPGLVPVEFHRYLNRAEETRIIGDYGSEGRVSKARAGEMLGRAKQFLALAEQMLGPLPPGETEVE